MDECLDRLTKKKQRRHRLQNYKICNKRGDVTTIYAIIKTVIKEYHKQLNGHNFYN